MKCKKLFKFEIAGIFIVFILGFIWHNLYDTLGQNTIIGMIAPVNESTWEHWKIGIYPILIYAAIEYKFVKDEANNFLFSKVIGIFIFELVTFGLIGLWHSIVGESNMIVHIVAYFLGIVAAQLASYYIACNTEPKKSYWYFAVIVIALHIIILILFTFNPPKMKYFQDSITGKYGIYGTE